LTEGNHEEITSVGGAMVLRPSPALWLFGSGLLGLIGVSRKKYHE